MMFGPSAGDTTAIQKEQIGGRKPFVPYRHGGATVQPPTKKKPMRFGNAPPAQGLDMGAILGNRR